MNTGTQGRVRRLARRLGVALLHALLALLILVALCVALASQLLPLLARHPDAVARWLGAQIGAPVELAAVEANWNRAGPLLTLSGLRIGSTPEVLDIGSAQLQINVYAGLWPGIALTELRLHGPELELQRQDDGRWRLDGLGRGAVQEGASPMAALDRFGAIDIVKARLRLRDAQRELDLTLPQIDARMQRRGRRLQFGALVHGAHGGQWRIAGDVAGDGREGHLYLEGLQQDWAAWARGLSWHGVGVTRAHGDLRLWLDFSDGQPTGLQLESTLAPFNLHGVIEDAEGEGRLEEIGADFSHWQARARWQRGADGWRMQVPLWQVRHGDDDIIDALRQAHATRDAAGGLVRVQVDGAELGPLLQLASLAPQLPAAVRHWLAEAAPQARLHEAQATWFGPQAYTFQARVQDLGWSPASGIPALHGVSGLLDGDARAQRLRLQGGLWDMQAPGMLREGFAPSVSGEVIAWQDDEGRRIETPGLRLFEDHYDISLAGGVQFPREGGVLLDLRSDVAEAPIVVAKRFWPINVMPSAAVRWLDDALLDGTVRHGRALVRGNVRDWPFHGGEGRFEATAELADAQIRYRNDWPLGEKVGGDVRFVNTGMELDLHGEVAGVTIRRAQGSIPDFGDAILQLDVEGDGSGAALLEVLRRSPLQRQYGDYMRGLRLGGQGAVALALHIPLEAKLGEPRVDGHADIERVDLHDTTWGVDFDAASGRVRFSERGFLADELNVGFNGALGALTVAVGGYTSEDGHLVEASLRGRFPAHVLTAQHEASRWLKPWLAGDSDWNLQLTVPSVAPDQSAAPVLRVRSDLVGTAITLPAPMRKTASDRMALDLSLGLPLEDAGLDLRLGGLLHLRGRNDGQGGFSGLAAFGEVADTGQRDAVSGLHIAGQVPVLDLAAWAAVASASPEAGQGLHVASVDLFAGELNLLGRPFHETRAWMQREASHLEIGVSGPALDGSLQIPFEGLALKGIVGNFRKLHWPGSENDAEAQQDADAGTFSPATLPPLHLEVADAAFAGAHLGTLWLETYPTAEGMHVERLDAQSDAVSIKAKGDWNADAQGQSSRVALDFSAADAGAMLEALGFSRLLDGGAAHGQLSLAWPGSPGEFAWEHADGELSLALGKGRVLEVEPGAGRLFGLLSLTEIPRRLALDFSDFFRSGLAFNQMSGSFVIRSGNAVTEDFRIDAPSAEVRLRGRTGLAARDYDQTMEVLPKAGSMLPALGAIAGGPAGAAVGAVAQAVLRQPLKEMTRIVYHVAGSWSEPQITVLERESGSTSRGPADAGEETGTGTVPPQEPLPVPDTEPRPGLSP